MVLINTSKCYPITLKCGGCLAFVFSNKDFVIQSNIANRRLSGGHKGRSA